MNAEKEILNKHLTKGADTYLAGQEDNIEKAMKEYARQACKEQRLLCVQAYIMQKGHHLEENINAITNAPEPAFARPGSEDETKILNS